jgi:hypothetical protein
MPADPPNVSDAQTMRPGSSGSESSGPGIVDRVRERAGAQLTSQKDRATDGIGTIAQAVRKTTQELRNDKHDGMADYVERAADQLDRLSAHLKGKDVGELFREAGDLARRKPVVFVGSAFVIGLLGARFLKSSRQGSAPAHPAWQRRGNNPGAEPLYRASSSYEADASRYRSGRIPSADVENL